MKTFVAVCTGSKAAMEKWKEMDADKRKEREKAGMEAWENWVATHKDAIVDSGSPLGKTKRISVSGIADTSNNIAAYTKVQAESHEAAAKLFVGHPHFTIFPGDGVEVMECLPMPNQ